MSLLKRIGMGIRSFYEGIIILRSDPSIRALAILPVFMSFFIYTLGLVGGVLYLDQILTWLIHVQVASHGILARSFIYTLYFLILLFILYVIAFIIVSFVSIPVCSKLAQRTLLYLGKHSDRERNLVEKSIVFINMFRVSIQKTVLFLIISVCISFASLLPIISPVAVGLSLLILVFDSMDYVLEIKELGFRERFLYFKAYWLEMGGIAIFMSIIILIPLVHFMLVPMTVIATTVLYEKLEKRRIEGNL